jgi:hypothetical protein
MILYKSSVHLDAVGRASQSRIMFTRYTITAVSDRDEQGYDQVVFSVWDVLRAFGVERESRDTTGWSRSWTKRRAGTRTGSCIGLLSVRLSEKRWSISSTLETTLLVATLGL